MLSRFEKQSFGKSICEGDRAHTHFLDWLFTQPDPEQAPIELRGMRTRRISLGKYEEANKGGYIPHKQYVMIPMVNQVYIKLFISRQVQGPNRFVR